ncbi:uncharacterized protein LOC110464836 isoform X2 [Mizuhopecten yessoensis]|uniref:uncharacterized protein LOC110464836 isoform X2 n=1 Tax=Mizuhopecten yessoensis TaxID=6573 RepID=UPI000B45D5FF|nr:uncharacterized protein LOC110464836 isoform X2 [Mizuhopecten yessoensis]
MEYKKFKDKRPAEPDNDSDSNDIIYVNPTDHDGPNFVPTSRSRNQRLQTRGIKKITVTAEDRSDQILRDAGIDTTGMSKQEKREFVKVIMMSKDEATPKAQKTEVDMSSEDALNDGWNSCGQTPHTKNRRDNDSTTIPDHDSIYKHQQPFISHEQSKVCVDQVAPNEESQDDKSRDKPKRTKILTGYSQNKVRIGRHNQSDIGNKSDGDVTKESTSNMEDKDMQQTILVKDAGIMGKQKTKREPGKRTTTQSKSVADERPKKQRKMEQYSHIVIDDDIPNTGSDTEMMDQRKSQKVLSAVTEDDDTQPPDSPEVFEFESPEEPEGIKVVNTPDEEDETTQEVNYNDGQQSQEIVQDSQMTPPVEDDSTSARHRLAGRTPPPRTLQKIHHVGEDISTSGKGSSTKSRNQSVLHHDSIPSETKVAFNFKSLKNKVVEMAHIVQNKFSHKCDKDGKGGSSGEPDITRKDSSSSQESDFYDVPALRRHYRRAKKVTQKYPLYAPDPGSVLSYTTVILQLMEIYSRKLTEAQAKAAEMIAWGEPVKCGRHVENTLDFAPTNRSRQNMYKAESSEEDEFVPYRPRSAMMRRPIRLKGNHSKANDDPDFVPEFSRGDTKALYDMDTQPFGDDVVRTENAEAALLDDNKHAITPSHQRQKQNSVKDEIISVGTDVDGWMSVEKQKNLPRIQRRRQSSDEKLTGKPEDCVSDSVKRRTAVPPVAHEVKPVRRTIYTGIPTNPGAVKKKEPQDIYNLSDDNSGEEFLTLKKGGANYKNRSTRSRHAKLQRKLLERSDSGYSIESIPSDDELVKHKGKMTRQKSSSPSHQSGLPSPPNLQTESSMDSLSQQSAAMINAQGELYSTQMCIQRERSAMKKRKQGSKQIPKDDNVYSVEEETETKDKRRKRMPSGQGEKRKESIKETSSAKGSSIDSCSDKSNDSAETQDYVGRVSPSVSVKSTEQLPVLREEPTLVDDMITPTDSPDNEDPADCLEKMDSQSPNFKKGRSAKKLKIAQFKSVECDTEVSFKESPDITDLGDVGPAVLVWEQQISTNIEDTRRGKRTRQHHQEMDVQKKRKQEPISLVPCPLCSIPFPHDQIEAHAAECEGSEVVNVSNGAIQKSSAEYEDDDGSGGHYEMPADGPMGFFQNSPRQAYSPSPQKHQTGKANDKSSKELTGETTEPVVRQMMLCYLCDENLPVGQEYDKHVAICLMEAQQRQAEADARGYIGARNSSLVTPEKRSTRSRIKEEQDSKLLGGLDQAWHQNEGD